MAGDHSVPAFASGLVGLLAVAVLVIGCGGTTERADAPPATVTLDGAAPAGARSAPINPTAPVVLHAHGGRLTSVTFTNTDTGATVTGERTGDGASWHATEELGYGARYALAADAVNPDGEHVRASFTVATLAPTDTAYANVVPAPETVAQNGIGVGQPMVFQFTEPVRDKAEVQRHLRVTTTPSQPGAWYWTDDRNVHYRGPEYWKPGTRVHVEADVYGLDLGGGVYGAEDNAADYTVHDSWIAEADGATERLTVFHDGRQVRQMPMSLGDTENPSHSGPHVVSERSASTVMDSCTFGVCQGDPGYYRETVFSNLRISNDGEFVHAAPWSTGQQGVSNVSHGCVNLSPADAKWMYDTFGIGDVVEVSNSGGDPLPVWDTYGDWAVPWDTWKAGNATA